MSNQFEKQNTSFKTHDGREAKLKISDEKKINHGAWGNIYDCTAEVDGYKQRFIIKRYEPNIENFRIRTPEEAAKHALENYALATKAGLKVFTTFRIGEDGKSILMTSGFSDNQICIGSNDDRIKVIKLGQPRIEKIENENLDKFLENIFAEGLKAAEAGIGLDADIFFFIISKDKPKKIDFVVGDLDNMEEVETSKSVGFANMGFIADTLEEFCENNINYHFKEYFLSRVEHYYKQSIDSVYNSEKLN